MKDGAELARALAAASGRARAAGRAEGSLDLLWALCSAENAARALLAERGATPESLEASWTKERPELTGAAQALVDRARELARSCGSPEAEVLHLLVALCRVPCAAHEALAARGLELGPIGNQALAYCVSGRVPRRLRPGWAGLPEEEPEERAPGRRRPAPLAGTPRGGDSPGSGPGQAPTAARAPRHSPVEPRDGPSPKAPPSSRGGARTSPRAGDLPEGQGERRPARDASLAERLRRPSPVVPADSAATSAPAPGAVEPAAGERAPPTEAVAAAAHPPAPAPPRAAPGDPPPQGAGGQHGSPHPPPTPPKSWTPRRKPPPPGAPIDEKNFPTLHELGRNLSELARLGKLDPVVGRDREIEQVIDILGKRRTNNPCLVGEAGVGKTAVVEGVAQKLRGLKGQLGQCAVFELDVGSLVAGTQLRGSLSERIFALKDEVRAADGRVVVFIDELHTLVGAGATGEGAQDASNELKTALARGEFPCIGATTHDEYQAHVLSDPALERRFTRVVVPEPTVQQTVAILKGLVTRYEAHHRLRFSHAAVEAIPALAARYIPDRHLPDKALAVLDLAGSRGHREGKTFVQLPDVARVVAQVAGIPEHRLLVDESQRLLKLEEALAARVVGHAESLRAVAQVIRRNYAGFSSQRPMGSFLVLGPTGVGKTELARALADVLFGSRDALVRVDMSEFSEPHAVSRLVGSPAGYVGHAEGGQLTEAVRRRPSCVVLLDEIEKAHRGAWMLLLQLLEEGQLTDGRGRHINFSHSVVLLTSNLGAEAFSGKKAAAPARAEALATAQRVLPPELWNRLDERLVFEPLGEADVARVARLLIRDSAARLAAEKSIHYEVDDAVVPYLLANGGYDAGLGARPLRQAVQRLLEAPLADRVLAGTLKSGDRVRVEVRWGALHFEHAAR